MYAVAVLGVKLVMVLGRCVPANAIAQRQTIEAKGPIIAPAVASGSIQVVAGVYNLANGAVSIVS